jgi:hypothetical protein
MTDFTIEELSALRRALASGTLVVRTGDQEVRYGSFEDLRARLAYIEARMSITSAPVARGTAFRRV